MQSETSRPRAETRTITVKGQRLRIAIRPGNGTRTPLLLMNGIGSTWKCSSGSSTPWTRDTK